MAKSAIKLKPVGEFILVEAVEEDSVTASGLIIQTSGKGERPQKGTIIALGSGKKDDAGKPIAFSVSEGDVVLFKRYAPEEVEMDGHKYLLMREADILAVVLG